MRKTFAMLALSAFLATGSAVAQTRLDVDMTLEEKLAKVQSIPFLAQLTEVAYQNQDWERYQAAVRRMAELRPYNQRYLFQLAAAYSLADEKSRAYDLLLQIQQEGLSANITDDADFENIRGSEVYDYIVHLLRENAKHHGEGEIVVKIDQPELIFNTVVWDPTREQMLTASARTGSIYQVGSDGSLNEWIKRSPENGLRGAFALGVDADRDLLWVTSADTPAFEAAGEMPGSALHKFRLSTGAHLQTFEAPEDGVKHHLSSLALAPNGDVFVADRLTPTIYRLFDGGDELSGFVALTGRQGIRGLTFGEEGRVLYAADPAFGLFAIHLEQQRVYELKREKLNLGGIEGIAVTGRELVIVQNGIYPQRVMRLDLDETGLVIENVHPVEANHPLYEAPTSGYIDGRDLIYLANAQRTRFTVTGEPTQDLNPSIVLRSSLDFESDIEPELFDPNKGKLPVGVRAEDGDG